MKMNTLTGVVAGAILLVGCGGDESVVGLLSNPDFATNTTGWAVEDPGSATLSWSSLDADGAAGSGSALVTNTSAGPSNGSGIFQCASSITAGASYTFGGRVLFPSGQARTGQLQIGLRWRAGANCTGSVLGDQPRVVLNTPGALWVPLTSDVLVAPAGTISADFIAFPTKYEAGGQLAGNFDALFLEKSVGSSLILTP